MREIKNGMAIIYHDDKGKPHDALIAAYWGNNLPPGEIGSVNLVYVTDNPNEYDQYGCQVKRDASVVHKSHQCAHGQYWRLAEEEPNR